MKLLSIIAALIVSVKEGRRMGQLLLNHWFDRAYDFVVLKVLLKHAARITNV